MKTFAWGLGAIASGSAVAYVLGIMAYAVWPLAEPVGPAWISIVALGAVLAMGIFLVVCCGFFAGSWIEKFIADSQPKDEDS